MEKIQERALKCVYSINTASNEYLLNKARLPSLEAGRQMNIAIQTFKILNDLGTYHLISGGGGLEFLLLANFFLPPVENKLFFGDQRPTIYFFMFR